MLGVGFALLNYTDGFVGFAELITVKTRTPMNVELGQDAMLECTFETTEDSTNGLSAIFEFESSGSTSPIQVHTNTSVPMYGDRTSIA